MRRGEEVRRKEREKEGEGEGRRGREEGGEK